MCIWKATPLWLFHCLYSTRQYQLEKHFKTFSKKKSWTTFPSKIFLFPCQYQYLAVAVTVTVVSVLLKSSFIILLHPLESLTHPSWIALVYILQSLYFILSNRFTIPKRNPYQTQPKKPTQFLACPSHRYIMWRRETFNIRQSNDTIEGEGWRWIIDIYKLHPSFLLFVILVSYMYANFN